jgi:hypothetical protein
VDKVLVVKLGGVRVAGLAVAVTVGDAFTVTEVVSEPYMIQPNASVAVTVYEVLTPGQTTIVDPTDPSLQ